MPPLPETVFAEISIQRNAWGSLLNTLYRTSMLRLRVELNDGSIHEHRIASGLVKTGFILSPYIQNNRDFLALFEAKSRQNLPKVKRFSIHSDWGSFGKGLWQPEIQLKLKQLVF